MGAPIMSGLVEERQLWMPTRGFGAHWTSHLYARRESPFIMSKEFFWACELNKTKKDFEWRLDSETDDEGVMSSHSLLLKQAVLGSTAAVGEENVVEVETTGYNDVKLRCPIVELCRGNTPQRCLDLYLPTGMLKFHLIKGSGPVHLYGQHIVEYDGEEEQSEEHVEEEEEENGGVEESPEMPQKRKATQPAKGNAKKMAKLDTSTNSASEKTEESEAPEEEESSSPEKKKKKPRGRGKSTEEKATPRKKK